MAAVKLGHFEADAIRSASPSPHPRSRSPWHRRNGGRGEPDGSGAARFPGKAQSPRGRSRAAHQAGHRAPNTPNSWRSLSGLRTCSQTQTTRGGQVRRAARGGDDHPGTQRGPACRATLERPGQDLYTPPPLPSRPPTGTALARTRPSGQPMSSPSTDQQHPGRAPGRADLHRGRCGTDGILRGATRFSCPQVAASPITICPPASTEPASPAPTAPYLRAGLRPRYLPPLWGTSGRRRSATPVYTVSAEIIRSRRHRRCAMCHHRPPCPPADCPVHRNATHIVAFHPEQTGTLPCNGVIVFDDLGQTPPGGRVVPRHRPAHVRKLPVAALDLPGDISSSSCYQSPPRTAHSQGRFSGHDPAGSGSRRRGGIVRAEDVGPNGRDPAATSRRRPAVRPGTTSRCAGRSRRRRHAVA